MPWLRPMVGVYLCSKARRFSTASNRSRSAKQDVGGLRQLHRKAGVEHVARGHPLVHEARLGADMLGEVGQKRDHVVAGFALDLVDALGLEAAALPDGARGALGDDAERRLRIAGMRLDLEPDPVPVLRRPDPGHLGPAVARDHVDRDLFVAQLLQRRGACGAAPGR